MDLPLLEFTTAIQLGPSPGPTIDPGSNLVWSAVNSAVSAFLTTLVVGALLVAVVPDYTDRKIVILRTHPVSSFLYGFVLLFFLFLVIIVLGISLAGIFVAIPLSFVLWIVGAVGAAIGFLAVGERLIGREDGWAKPLAVGAVINGALTLTGIGAIVGFAIGAAGLGAVLRDFLG